MSEEMPFYKDTLQRVIQFRRNAFEALWLDYFDLSPVEAVQPLFIVNPALQVEVNSANFSHLNPQALEVTGGSSIGVMPGNSFESFIHGAASVVNFLPPNDSGRVMDFLKIQIEAMNQRVISELPPFPNLDERLFQFYPMCVSFVLLTDEYMAWRPLMEFTAGALWFAGFVSGLDFEVFAQVLIDRLKTGTYHV